MILVKVGQVENDPDEL